MLRVYNASMTTFLLTAEDGGTLRVPYQSFVEVQEKFAGDVTYRQAVRCGALQPFTSAKEGEAAQRQANEIKTGGKKAGGKAAREAGLR